MITPMTTRPVSYTHLRAHETVLDLVCRLLLEKKKTTNYMKNNLFFLDDPQQSTYEPCNHVVSDYSYKLQCH